MKVNKIHGTRKAAAAVAGLLVTTMAVSACEIERPAALTLAFTATSAEPEPSAQALHSLLSRHASRSVLPGDGLVRFVGQGGQAEEADLTPMRGDEVENTTSKAAKAIARHLEKFDGTVRGLTASTPGTDVLGVLDQALEITPEGGTVVVVSSGLSTVAPLDLNRAGDWTVDPDGVARAIDQRNLPDASGRDIVFVGLGYVAGEQPTPRTAARSALRTLWLSVCERLSAASCKVESGPVGTAPPSAVNEVPVVALDEVTTNCAGTTTLSADVLFPPDSARLSGRADRVLRPLARGLSACPAGRVVDAVGHYAEVPGGGDGGPLSAARAKAVLVRLALLGAPQAVLGRAIGCGGAVPCQLVDNTPGGIYREALAKQNRVVELTIRAN